MKLYTPREAAQVLGISYPTLKQWIYKGKLGTVKTAGGHHRVPEKEVDKFLYRASEQGDVSERRTNYRKISGRNQLVGRVTDIKISGLIAQVSPVDRRAAHHVDHHGRCGAGNAAEGGRQGGGADQVHRSDDRPALNSILLRTSPDSIPK